MAAERPSPGDRAPGLVEASALDRLCQVAQAFPVGVAVDLKGALLVADDVGGVVWRVAPNRQP